MGMTAEQAYVLAKNSNAGGGGTGITVDSELSLSSANPVQNKAVTKKLNDDYNSLNGAITDLNADVSSNTTAITEQTNRISNVSNTVDAITFGDGLKSINLLNPTLETSTLGNLTLAFNKENKTYTLNGSVAATKWFEVGKIELKANTTYYLSGTPKNANGCCMALKNYYGGGRDEGDGIVLTSSENTIKEVYIYYPANTQVDNLVFKPMITDNLNATFDSFVAYCGEGASVGENIASLYREVANLKTALSMLTGEATGDISAISGITYSNEVIDEPTIG